MSGNGEKRQVTIITVHGTGDTAAGPDGDKWFQNGSAFAARLKQRLTAQGVDAEIVPHLWSGANSARGREAGANALADRLRKLRKSHDAIHLIGHSHGGNVANDAAVAIGWKGEACKSKVKSLSTVGTPFFRREVGIAEWVASWVFYALATISLIGMALVVVGVVVSMFATPRTRPPPPAQHVYERMERDKAQRAGEVVSEAEIKRRAEETRSIEIFAYAEMAASKPKTFLFGLIILVPVLAGTVGVFFLRRIARTGWLRVSRIRRRPRSNTSVFSMWHQNDEAIAFLSRVEALPVKAFPPGALWRGSHQVAINTGVQVICLGLLVGGAIAIAGANGVEKIFGWKPDTGYFIGRPYDPATGAMQYGNPLLELAGFLAITSPILFAVLFAVTYGLTRIVAGVIPELTMRGWYNGLVTNALKGIAFGKDGDERIGRVSPRSHYFATTECILDGDVAARMQTNSQGAAGALIEKYRWSLFSVDGGDETAVDALATDAMTWDSLIHTTYFDQPEVADIIADQIAATHA